MIQHWHRFRLGALPIISFVLMVLLTLALWEKQAYNGSVIGEIQGQRLDVVADMSGEIMTGSATWQLFQPVQQGDVIAQLDNQQTLARYEAAQAELVKLGKDLEAVRSNHEIEAINARQQQYQEWLRLKIDYEDKQVEFLQLTTQVRIDKASLQEVKDSIEQLSGLLTGPGGLAQLEREASDLQTRIAESEPLIRLTQQQRNQAKELLDAYSSTIELPEVDSLLAPIRAGISVQEAVIEELDAELASLQITAPIGGVIAAVHRRPGQRVVAGDPIVTIASKEMTYVLSYVRETNPTPLRPGMGVVLRLRKPGATHQDFRTQVEEVGPHVEPVPPHQLNDQSLAEWATPIKIRIPDSLRQQGVRPGDLLNVILHDSQTAQAQ